MDDAVEICSKEESTVTFNFGSETSELNKDSTVQDFVDERQLQHELQSYDQGVEK